VWAIFWIIFQIAALIGFVFIGIVSFKLTGDQMRAEAGKFLVNTSASVPSAIDNIEHSSPFSEFSPNIAQPRLFLSPFHFSFRPLYLLSTLLYLAVILHVTLIFVCTPAWYSLAALSLSDFPSTRSAHRRLFWVAGGLDL
jgi:hypothetical protein